MRKFFWESMMMKYSRSNGNFFRIVKIQLQVDEYTRLVEEETLIGKRIVFFANLQIFWGQTTVVLVTVEIRNFTWIRQKILR